MLINLMFSRRAAIQTSPLPVANSGKTNDGYGVEILISRRLASLEVDNRRVRIAVPLLSLRNLMETRPRSPNSGTPTQTRGLEVIATLAEWPGRISVMLKLSTESKEAMWSCRPDGYILLS